MSFEEPKPSYDYDHEPTEDVEQIIPGESIEINKKPKEKRFTREFQKLFPTVLEDAEARDSLARSEAAFTDEMDFIKHDARQKINSKLENTDVKKSTSEKRQYKDEFNEYLPTGTREALPVRDDPNETSTSPQMIGSVLEKSGYPPVRSGGPSKRGRLRIESSEPTAQQSGNVDQSSTVKLAVQVGFIGALIAIFILMLAYF